MRFLPRFAAAAVMAAALVLPASAGAATATANAAWIGSNFPAQWSEDPAATAPGDALVPFHQYEVQLSGSSSSTAPFADGIVSAYCIDRDTPSTFGSGSAPFGSASATPAAVTLRSGSDLLLQTGSAAAGLGDGWSQTAHEIAWMLYRERATESLAGTDAAANSAATQAAIWVLGQPQLAHAPLPQTNPTTGTTDLIALRDRIVADSVTYAGAVDNPTTITQTTGGVAFTSSPFARFTITVGGGAGSPAGPGPRPGTSGRTDTGSSASPGRPLVSTTIRPPSSS